VRWVAGAGQSGNANEAAAHSHPSLYLSSHGADAADGLATPPPAPLQTTPLQTATRFSPTRVRMPTEPLIFPLVFSCCSFCSRTPSEKDAGIFRKKRRKMLDLLPLVKKIGAFNFYTFHLTPHLI
jgi:hypothetical protein